VALPKVAANRPLVREDFAIMLLILAFFHENPNDDGSLPHARARALWKSLYECGDVSRCWSNDKWKVMRDFFSGIGYINWQDQKYYLGEKVNGEYVKGRACKWRLDEEIANTVNENVVDVSILILNTNDLYLAILCSSIQRYPSRCESCVCHRDALLLFNCGNTRQGWLTTSREGRHDGQDAG
jgi:hypothetical protein